MYKKSNVQEAPLYVLVTADEDIQAHSSFLSIHISGVRAVTSVSIACSLFRPRCGRF